MTTPGLFGGAQALPCRGGIGEQPAALMDAFAALSGWAAEEQQEAR